VTATEYLEIGQSGQRNQKGRNWVYDWLIEEHKIRALIRVEIPINI
jgi:hypothetical protein